MSHDVSVLFVCLGNICRSPTAEGVFRRLVAEAGLEERVRIDSAGTSAYHLGEAPDRRAQTTAAARGYDLSAQRARQFGADDCRGFDYLIAMDSDNEHELRARCQDGSRVRRLLEFAPETDTRDVPDPYYGGERGFETVLDLVEAGCRGLLKHIKMHNLK